MLPMRLPLHLVCNSCESKFVIFPVGLTCFIFQGIVALDDACILLQPTEEMAMTDMASHALNALEESSIRFLVIFLKARGSICQFLIIDMNCFLRWLLQLLLNPLQVNMNCTLFSSTNLIVFQNQKKNKKGGHFSGVHCEKIVLKGIPFYTCLTIGLHVDFVGFC